MKSMNEISSRACKNVDGAVSYNVSVVQHHLDVIPCLDGSSLVIGQCSVVSGQWSMAGDAVPHRVPIDRVSWVMAYSYGRGEKDPGMRRGESAVQDDANWWIALVVLCLWFV